MPSAISLALVLFTFVNVLCTPIVAAQRTAAKKTATSISHSPSHSPSPSPSAGIQRKPPCANIRQRREWRTLSDVDKASYIRAVRCLQLLPAEKPVFPQAKSRYDEFQAYHIKEADSVHVTGEFLPWHRQYVKVYEDDLRNKCGYKGANPYWDWSQDTDSSQTLAAAPVFDPKTGFGGDGAVGTYSLPSPNPPADYRINATSYRGCVMDGPFANHTVPLGPGKYIGDHCLTRGIHEDAKAFLNHSAVAKITKLPTYELFRIELEGLPLTDGHRLHDGGHYAIGGDMSNFYSSPGDPLFYLHHANLDRIWWHWQQMVPSRLYEISGRSTTTPPFNNVTLHYPLNMGSLGPSVVIQDVMDIHSEPNCYTYV